MTNIHSYGREAVQPWNWKQKHELEHTKMFPIKRSTHTGFQNIL